MFYYFYILKKSNGNLYYGYTSDLRRRLREHQNAIKCELVYYEAYSSKEDAIRRERSVKRSGQARRWLKTRIEDCLKGRDS